jgi:hypothetical protein
MPDVNAPFAAFGTTDLKKIQQKAGERPAPPSKYKEFMDAIHSAAFSDKNIDEQTELLWDNIEGECMGVVLTEDIVSGTMFLPVRNRMFKFKDPKKQVKEFLFVGKFVEGLNKNPQLIPAITTGKQKLNELMVSFQRHGRMELVEMLKAFQVQLQETNTDPNRAVRRL